MDLTLGQLDLTRIVHLIVTFLTKYKQKHMIINHACCWSHAYAYTYMNISTFR